MIGPFGPSTIVRSFSVGGVETAIEHRTGRQRTFALNKDGAPIHIPAAVVVARKMITARSMLMTWRKVEGKERIQKYVILIFFQKKIAHDKKYTARLKRYGSTYYVRTVRRRRLPVLCTYVVLYVQVGWNFQECVDEAWDLPSPWQALLE